VVYPGWYTLWYTLVGTPYVHPGWYTRCTPWLVYPLYTLWYMPG